MRNLFVSALLAILSCGACATNNTNGRFVNAIVDCSEKNADPQLVLNVTQCLGGAVAGGYAQCLELLPFAVDEIVCVVSELSQAKAKAINSGTANAQDSVVLSNANAWLKASKVSRK